MIHLFNADCIKIAQNFAQNGTKFDAIITDPPYNISKKNNFPSLKNRRTGVDFGEWDKNFDPCNWLEFYTPFVAKNGCVIIFCSYIFLSFIIAKLENLGFATKDILRWEKSNPMPRNITRRYVQDTEFAVWAVRNGAKWTFNKQNAPYLRAKFTSPVVSGKEKTAHTTQKSLKIMREIIEIHTNKGDLICDPFMGSGTTGVAALELGRKFYGVEINEKYFKIVQNRLDF